MWNVLPTRYLVYFSLTFEQLFIVLLDTGFFVRWRFTVLCPFLSRVCSSALAAFIRSLRWLHFIFVR